VSEEFLEWLKMVSEGHSPIDFYLVFEHFDRFLWGVTVTLQLTALALVVGALLSVPLAVARTSSRAHINGPVWLFTYCFRGTPLLVQTYLIYYGLGQFEAVRESFLWKPILSSAWWCAFIAFTLNTTAYTTEILRGAIAATPFGEVEAARATGMTRWTVLRRIVVPSALRRSLPAYSNEVIFMLHASVVASTITLQDILGVGRWLNGRYYVAYEGFITAAILYMILVFFIARGFRLWEKHWLAHLRDRVETLPASDLGR
jgi:arginine/ornithine transport system permease protein